MKSALNHQTKIKDFVKLEIDDSCTYVLASSYNTNDVLWIDMHTSRVMATLSIGEPTTWMKFTPDSKHLITCSSRGCFYVWKVPKEIYNTILFKNKQKEIDSIPTPFNNTMMSSITENQYEAEDDMDEGASPQDVNRK